MRVSLVLLIVIVLCAVDAQARIYTCKDENGNTIYSDTPTSCTNAEEIKTDKLPTLIETKPLATSSSRSSTSSSKEDDKNGYDSVAITEPHNDANIRDNSGVVNITLQATPALKTRRGHQYVVTLGGKEVYKGTKSRVSLNNMNRGTHQVKAMIIARNGRSLISSDTVSFTLHRFSRLQNEGIGAGAIPNSGSFPNNTNLPQRPPPPPATPPTAP